MIEPQTLILFQDAVADPRFAAAVGIAAVSGLVRGFSGFGSALIYMRRSDRSTNTCPNQSFCSGPM